MKTIRRKMIKRAKEKEKTIRAEAPCKKEARGISQAATRSGTTQKVL